MSTQSPNVNPSEHKGDEPLPPAQPSEEPQKIEPTPERAAEEKRKQSERAGG